MRYEVKISRRGRPFFSIGSSRIQGEEHLQEMLLVFRRKFQKREGFGIEVIADSEEYTRYGSIDQYFRAKIPSPLGTE